MAKKTTNEPAPRPQRAPRQRKCRTCRVPLPQDTDAVEVGVVRCDRCEPRFQAWLRGDAPRANDAASYTPRYDGLRGMEREDG